MLHNPYDIEISDERAHELLENVARKIVNRDLAVPAIFFLETVKPLNFIGSQALVAIGPFVQAFLNNKAYDEFCVLIQERENVEKLLAIIEQLDAELVERRQKEKQEQKKNHMSFWQKIKSKIKKKQ